jgi:UDP-glucose 4-epimerase
VDAAALSGVRALVTGGRGFLGSHVCNRLLRAGAEVHATSRSAPAAGGEIRWWQTGCGDEEEIASLFRRVRPEVVVHLSGAVTAVPGIEHVLPAYRTLLTSSVGVLLAASRTGCRRIVLTGSLTEPLDVEAAPSSPYAAAKWASTAYGRMFHALYGSPVVVLRPFMVYGPAQREEKLVPYVIGSLLRGAPPRLTDGTWKADWVYVEDVAEAFVRAASLEGVDGETFDLATGTLLPLREVADRIVRLMDSPVEPLYGALPSRPGEVIREPDVATSARRLGWRAETSLDDGLRRTIAWFREAHERL